MGQFVRVLGRVAAFRHFWLSSAGNMTMMATLAAVPLFAALGAGVDYVRVARETTSLQAAVDSALLAIIASDQSDLTGLSDSQKSQRLTELRSIAERFLEANYNSEQGETAAIEATVVINGDVVTMTAYHEMPMALMGIFGTPVSKITITSEAVRQKEAVTPIEISLVMDTTGSMGSTYMNQAKTAARNLLSTLYGGSKTEKPENANIRVSLVPFAAAVRLDQAAYDFSMDWIDTTGESSVSGLNFSNNTWHNYRAWTSLRNQPWNGCVEARPSGSAPFNYNVNDAPPTGGDSLFVPYFAPDEPTFSGSTSRPYYYDNSYIGTSGNPRETTGLSSTSTSYSNHDDRQKNVNKYVNKSISSEDSSSYGPWYNCAASPIVPMTYDRTKVETGITNMSAGGNTVIPEGLAWGWRTLSPGAPFTKVEAGPTIPAAEISDYSSKWKKVLVLMTDGENNVSGGLNSLNGSSYSAYGYASVSPVSKNRFGVSNPDNAESALDDAMLELCTNVKNAGIEVYTVAFRVNSSKILKNLKACASDLDHYSYAADGQQLSEVFSTIGESVKATMIHLRK